MRGGIWVLNIFAAAWGVAAVIIGRLPVWLAAIPVVVSLVVLFWASRQPPPAGEPVGGPHVGRIVGIWSAIEGVAMFLAANVLVNLHWPTAIMPVFAIIVGLHFAPLARGIPVRTYYATAGALVAVGLGALLLPGEERATVTGCAAALVLWASGILLVRRGSR